MKTGLHTTAFIDSNNICGNFQWKKVKKSQFEIYWVTLGT